MRFLCVIVFVTVLLLSDTWAVDEPCDYPSENGCSCLMEDGSNFSLQSTSLRTLSARSKYGTLYELNVCDGLQCETRKPVPLCYTPQQKSLDLAHFHSSRIRLINGIYPLLVYTGRHDKIIEIKLVCHKSQSKLICDDCILTRDILKFHLNTPDVCEFIEVRKGHKKTILVAFKRMSFGSALLLALFIIATLYLVIGVLYKKFGMKAEGADLLPNKESWLKLFANIKLGTRYITGRV